MRSFTVTLEEDENGDLIVPFPEDLLEEMKWGEGTVLDWEIIDGNVHIKEKKNSNE